MFCITNYHTNHINGHQQLGQGHGEPDGIRPGNSRQQEDQDAADDKPPGDGNDKRRLGLHNSLEIIGGEDIQRQQQERKTVGLDNGRRDLQDFLRWGHKQADKLVGDGQAEDRPDNAEKGGGPKSVPQGLPDAAPFSRPEVGGKNRLGRLAHAVGAALDESADVDDDPVNGKGVGAKVGHDLPVEEDGQDAHGDINEESGKAGDEDFPEFPEQFVGPDQPQGVFLPEKVGQHDDDGNHRTNGGGKPRAHGPHIAGEHKEIVPKDVKDAACQNAAGGQGWVLVIAEVGRQGLGEQEAGDHEFYGQDIFPGQCQGVAFRAEKLQKLTVKKGNNDPHDDGQDDRTDDGSGEILVGPANLPVPLAPDGAEDDGAADAHEEPQTVNNVPDGGHNRQRRRAFRPVVLAHHGHIHNGVDGSNQGAAEGGRQILEIEGFDFAA